MRSNTSNTPSQNIDPNQMQTSNIKDTNFLDLIFDEILNISKGTCLIDEGKIINEDDASKQKILQGLLFLHEDLELSKEDLEKSMEAKYKLKLLEKKNQELEQFGYAASHDLQEPLRTITSFSQILSRQYKGKLDQSADEYLHFIVDAAKRMSILIKDLLEHSRIGSNQKLSPINCNTILDWVQMDMAASLKASGAQVTVSELPVINADETEIRQLFQNLISNAVKFRKTDTVPIINIAAKAKENEWLFTVKDNGIGITEQYLQKIFSIFFKMYKTEDLKGSGIGLANCKRIVNNYDGKIWVTSVVDEGSCFYFTLPKN